MSWQDYVDIELIGSGYCRSAAIIGMDGSMFASTQTLALEKEEIGNVIVLFGDAKKRVAGNTLTLKQREYVIQTATERTIQLGTDANDSGAVLVKTRQMVLVATWADWIRPERCLFVVESLADYLLQKGF